MTTDVLCPLCKGEREIVGLFPKYKDRVPSSDRKAVISLGCPTCKGEGLVTELHRQQIAAGAELRDFRKRAPYIGLREAGHLLGFGYWQAESGELSLERIAEYRRQVEELKGDV